MCCRYLPNELYCIVPFSASCTHCPFPQFPSHPSNHTHSLSFSKDTWSHPGPGTECHLVATAFHLDTSPSLTAISFLPPSRPATSPFFHMQPRSSRTAWLAPRYTFPLVWSKPAAAAGLAATRKRHKETCRFSCIRFSRKARVVCLLKVENYGMAYAIDTVHVVVVVVRTKYEAQYMLSVL